MSVDWQPNAAELLIVFLIYIGIGLPLGIPPEEHLEVANILPEECLYAVTWAGTVPAEISPIQHQAMSDLVNEPEFERIRANLQEQITAKYFLWESLLEEAWNIEAARLLKEYGDDILKCSTTLFIQDVVPPANGSWNWQFNAGFASSLPRSVANLSRDLSKLESAINSDPRKLVLATPMESKNAKGCKVTSTIPGMPTISWLVDDRYFLMTVGNIDVVDLQTRLKGNAPLWFQTARNESDELRICTISRVNVGKVLEAFLPNAPSVLPAIRKELSESKFGAFIVTSGLERERCVVRSQLTLDHIPYNWQSLQQPPLTLSDLERIPDDVTYAVATKASLPQLWASFVLMTGKANGESPAGDAARQEFQSLWGLDLKSDVLDCFGSTICLYHSPGETGNILSGPTILLDVIEPEKLKIALERFAASLKQRENSDDYSSTISVVRSGDVDVYSLNSPDEEMPFSVSWCLVDDRLSIALFPQNLRSMLQTDRTHQTLAGRSELIPDFSSEARIVTYWYADTVKLADGIFPLLPWLKSLPIWNMGFDENVRRLDIVNLPAVALMRPYLRPTTGWMVFKSNGIEIEQRPGIVASGSIASLPVAAATLLPSMHYASIQAKYESSLTKLRTICNAVTAYHEDKGRLPPLYCETRDGKPGLSWRVLILPYLEQKNLFDKFRLEEPWDSPNNRPLLSLMPDVYRSDISKSPMDHTNFLAILGENSIWTAPQKPITIADVVDGDGLTLLAVEVDDDRAVIWTKPQEFDWRPENPTAGLGKLLRTNAFHAVFLDADATAISLVTDRPVIRALFTRNGNEEVDYGDVIKP